MSWPIGYSKVVVLRTATIAVVVLLGIFGALAVCLVTPGRWLSTQDPR